MTDIDTQQPEVPTADVSAELLSALAEAAPGQALVYAKERIAEVNAERIQKGEPLIPEMTSGEQVVLTYGAEIAVLILVNAIYDLAVGVEALDSVGPHSDLPPDHPAREGQE